MKSDVLLTGATGLIGGEIAWRLMKTGRRVWCLVRSASFADAAARLERRFAASGEQCDWGKVVALPGDVTKEFLGVADETLIHLRKECTQVIHCAAETSFAARNSCNQVNIAGTQNVLQVCAFLGPHVRLFLTSSAAACLEPAGALIREDTPGSGFCNDYVRSKRCCEEIVLQAPIDAVVLRPSIVLSHGVASREFARSVLWVLPVIRGLGVLPMRGDERIDVVSVRFVAEAVVRLLEQPLRHQIYHISAGPEASISWKELFDSLTRNEHDFSDVRFDPDMNWNTFGQSETGLLRLKQLVNYYLPFMRAGVVYDCSRLKHALRDDFPASPKVTEYCAQLLDLFTEREALEEAFNP